MASLSSDTQNRCGGCKHWDAATERERPVLMTEPDYDEKPLPGTWGTCERIPHRSSEYESDQPDNLDLAFLSDGSGYFASITTRAEFGCVLWEAKA